MLDFDTPGNLAAEAVSIVILPEKPAYRLTWYTAVLVGLFLCVAILTLHMDAPKVIRHDIRYSSRIIVLVVQWGLFYLAYRGVRASNQSLRDIMGRSWSSGWDLWDDFKDGMVLILLIAISTALLLWVEPFRRTGAVQPKTVLHFILALAVAVSAGYTEEIIFRGFLFRQFRVLFHPTLALLSQAVVFALAHGGNQSFSQFLKHLVGGCLFAHYVMKRRSLWPSIIAHVFLDSIGFLFPFIR